MRSSSTIVTADGQRYMTELCRRAGAASSTARLRESRLVFDEGEVYLRASPATLMILAEALESEALASLETLLEHHLKGLSASEPQLAVEWRRARRDVLGA